MSWPASVRRSFSFKKQHSIPFETDFGGRLYPRMSALVLKRVCLANTACPPTARPNCLWDTALSRAHSNVLLSILSSIKVCHKKIASLFLSSTISLDLSFWYPSKIKQLARLFVIWSNACSRCYSLQKHFIPTKARNLWMNWSRNYSQFWI